MKTFGKVPHTFPVLSRVQSLSLGFCLTGPPEHTQHGHRTFNIIRGHPTRNGARQ
jgi:hypothetical protein